MPNTDDNTTGIPGRIYARQTLASVLGLVALVAFGGVLVLGYAGGRDTLTGVVEFAFVAMLVGVGLRTYGGFGAPRQRLWAAGLASGAMLASAAAFLAPKAITHHPEYGGFAIAFGYLLGYGGHELGHLVGHRNLPLNATVAELTLHALLAGSIMGVAYGTLPTLTPLFGYGIVAHKLPAGFGGAEAVDRDDLPTVVMLLPASAVAIAAIPLSIATPPLGPVVRAGFFGVSTGLFAHVALDMIPECTGGGSGHGHGDVTCGPEPDRDRHHAVASTVLGAGTIFALWQLVAAL